jgi:hypothetical protein
MKKQKTGHFLGLPYDFRRPPRGWIKARVWNPDDPRIFGPKTFGWGWSINFYALLRRIGLIRRSR